MCLTFIHWVAEYVTSTTFLSRFQQAKDGRLSTAALWETAQIFATNNPMDPHSVEYQAFRSFIFGGKQTLTADDEYIEARAVFLLVQKEGAITLSDTYYNLVGDHVHFSTRDALRAYTEHGVLMSYRVFGQILRNWLWTLSCAYPCTYIDSISGIDPLYLQFDTFYTCFSMLWTATDVYVPYEIDRRQNYPLCLGLRVQQQPVPPFGQNNDDVPMNKVPQSSAPVRDTQDTTDAETVSSGNWLHYWNKRDLIEMYDPDLDDHDDRLSVRHDQPRCDPAIDEFIRRLPPLTGLKDRLIADRKHVMNARDDA